MYQKLVEWSEPSFHSEVKINMQHEYEISNSSCIHDIVMPILCKIICNMFRHKQHLRDSEYIAPEPKLYRRT